MLTAPVPGATIERVRGQRIDRPRWRRRLLCLAACAALRSVAAGSPGGFETRTVRWLEEPFAASALRVGRLLEIYRADHGAYPARLRLLDGRFRHLLFQDPEHRYYSCRVDGDGRTDVAALLLVAGGKTLRAYHQTAAGDYREVLVEPASQAHDLHCSAPRGVPLYPGMLDVEWDSFSNTTAPEVRSNRVRRESPSWMAENIGLSWRNRPWVAMCSQRHDRPFPSRRFTRELSWYTDPETRHRSYGEVYLALRANSGREP